MDLKLSLFECMSMVMLAREAPADTGHGYSCSKSS